MHKQTNKYDYLSKKNYCSNATSKSKIKLLLRMSVVFYSSFVYISAYANVSFTTTLWECLRAGLPPGFPSTASPPVCVLAVLGTQACGSQTKKNQKAPSSRATSGFHQYCASTCARFGCTRHASCVASKPKKNKKPRVRARVVKVP